MTNSECALGRFEAIPLLAVGQHASSGLGGKVLLGVIRSEETPSRIATKGNAGEPRALEHDSIAWAEIDELLGFNLAPSNALFVASRIRGDRPT